MAPAGGAGGSSGKGGGDHISVVASGFLRLMGAQPKLCVQQGVMCDALHVSDLMFTRVWCPVSYPALAAAQAATKVVSVLVDRPTLQPRSWRRAPSRLA
jgi:hypothetical protein